MNVKNFGSINLLQCCCKNEVGFWVKDKFWRKVNDKILISASLCREEASHERQSSLQSVARQNNFAVWFLFFNLFMNFASWGVLGRDCKCFLNEPKLPLPGCIGLQLSFNFSIRDDFNLGAESLSVPSLRVARERRRRFFRVQPQLRGDGEGELLRMKCKKVQVG